MYKKTNSDKSMDFTIYKDEIHKNIAEIQRSTRISWNILRIYAIFRETDQRTEFQIECTM